VAYLKAIIGWPSDLLNPDDTRYRAIGFAPEMW